jgi:hypothetical protein
VTAGGRIHSQLGFPSDLALVAVILDGIRKQVSDDLGDAVRVASDFDGSEVGLDLNSALRSERPDQVHTALDCFIEVEALVLHRFLAGIEAGKLEERLG